MHAARLGKLEVTRTLLADPRVDPEARKEDGGTALMVAAWNGHAPVVQVLLADSRVAPNLPNEQGVAALTPDSNCEVIVQAGHSLIAYLGGEGKGSAKNSVKVPMSFLNGAGKWLEGLVKPGPSSLM